MIIRVLDKTGDSVLTDMPTTEGLERVRNLSSAELEKEFNALVKEGYTPVNDQTNKIMKGFIDVESVTMLYPVIGG